MNASSDSLEQNTRDHVTFVLALRDRLHASSLIVNFTRLFLLVLTLLALTGEAVTQRHGLSALDKVHGCVEVEYEKEVTSDNSDAWGKSPMVPWLTRVKDQAMMSALGKTLTGVGQQQGIYLGLGMKMRRHRWLAVDLI